MQTGYNMGSLIYFQTPNKTRNRYRLFLKDQFVIHLGRSRLILIIYFYFNFWSTDFFLRDAHSGQQHKHLQNRNIYNCISLFKNQIWYQNRTWRKPQYQCDKYHLTITEYFLRRFLYFRKH